MNSEKFYFVKKSLNAMKFKGGNLTYSDTNGNESDTCLMDSNDIEESLTKSNLFGLLEKCGAAEGGVAPFTGRLALTCSL